jgi:enamine deaminase RidA (YjgF/YER057c/UK114 family)
MKLRGASPVLIRMIAVSPGHLPNPTEVHTWSSAAGLPPQAQLPGIHWRVLGPPDNRQFDLTLLPLPGESRADLFGRLTKMLRENAAVPVLQWVFGSLESLAGGEAELRAAWGEITWPVMWVEGADCVRGGLAGVQVMAVSQRDIQSVRVGDRVLACVFEDGQARHCLLGGLGTPAAGAPPEQAQQTMEQLAAVLQQAGFAFGDLIRTWFYLDDLLSWYGEFNQVRTTFYGARPFRIGSLPASTGIEARNPFGTALAVGAWAIQPLKATCTVREIASPLQCPAPAYGSSFSRAMEIATPVGRRLLISGTASIEPGGATLWIGDIQRQISLTMEVVEAILKSRGMGFAHTTRAIAYFKEPAFAAVFADWNARAGAKFPTCLVVHDAICRDDLLFELELDAASAD